MSFVWSKDTENERKEDDMLKRIEALLFKGMVRGELLKRSLPFVALVLLALAAEACKKKR